MDEIDAHPPGTIPPASDDSAHPHPAADPALPSPTRPSRSKLITLGAAFLAILVTLLAIGWLPRMRRAQALKNRAHDVESLMPAVTVAKPRRATAATELLLPGTVEALQETTIYARSSGYVNKWLVDIGDKVKKGQVMAIIDTPELDQQLGEARATLSQSKATLTQSTTNKEYARTSMERVKALTPSGVASREDLDQHVAASHASEAGARAAAALVAANEANVRRLADLKAFSRVAAPFSGRVTSRTTENGALINAGSGTGQALFRVAQADPVRIFVNVPQSYAALIKVGQPTELLVREFPDIKFKGSVARTTQALDATSHTLLTEVHVPNPKGTLLTGAYAQVKFAVTREHGPISVPGSAIIIAADGPEVALVADGDRVHFQKVQLGIDYGTEVEIIAGLTGPERVIANPGQRLADGIQVRIVTESDSPLGAAAAH